YSMRDAFAEDPQRFAKYSLQHEGLLLDFSKNLLTEQTLELLQDLAQQTGVKAAIQQMFSGEPINGSEQRPALHTTLRRPIGDRLEVNGQDIIPEIHQVLQRITELVGKIHN